MGEGVRRTGSYSSLLKKERVPAMVCHCFAEAVLFAEKYGQHCFCEAMARAFSTSCSMVVSVYAVSNDRGEQARFVEGVFWIRFAGVMEYRIRSGFAGFGRWLRESEER